MLKPRKTGFFRINMKECITVQKINSRVISDKLIPAEGFSQSSLSIGRGKMKL